MHFLAVIAKGQSRKNHTPSERDREGERNLENWATEEAAGDVRSVAGAAAADAGAYRRGGRNGLAGAGGRTRSVEGDMGGSGAVWWGRALRPPLTLSRVGDGNGGRRGSGGTAVWNVCCLVSFPVAVGLRVARFARFLVARARS
jgi:hypothetical protein